MRYLNRTENPNGIAGIFLLILLAVFAGPNVLPRLLAEQFPFIYEGVPCDWLRAGEDRATHQSLLGRAVAGRLDPPLTLSISTNDLPAAPDEPLVILITVTNQTIGSVPILVTSQQVIIGGNTGENGLGITFNNGAVPPAAATTNSYPESQLRLLGPRQRCVHRVNIQRNQIPPQDLSLISTGTGSIKAFYRNSSPGAAAPVFNTATIYADQGLWVGVVELPSVDIGIEFVAQ